jgi:hypothetical protein
VSNLASAIAELASEDVTAVDADTLAADLIELRRRINQLEFQFVRRVRAFDSRGAWRRDGAVSAGAWLRTHCRLGPGAAHGGVRLARRLDHDLPKTAEALAAGDVSFTHAQMIAAATADLPPKHTAETERELVESACDLDVERFRDVVADWQHSFDEGAARLEARQNKARCRFTIRRSPRGTSMLEGELDGEGSATLSTALDAVMGPPRGPALLRSPAQRRAEALVELARRLLDGGTLSTNGGERPHVSVVAPLETLEQRAGAPMATIEWGGPICGEAARRLACDAEVSRVITDGRSEPLDVGRSTRTIPAALRRAIVARDRHCIFPGCDRPPPWADVHHFVHWADGGTTSLENCGLCCRPHHWLFHEGGWSICRRADGTIEVLRPGGRPLVPP